MFKVGEKVRINTKDYEPLRNAMVSYDMKMLDGHITTITNVYNYNNIGVPVYNLEVDGGNDLWFEHMLERYVEEYALFDIESKQQYKIIQEFIYYIVKQIPSVSYINFIESVTLDYIVDTDSGKDKYQAIELKLITDKKTETLTVDITRLTEYATLSFIMERILMQMSTFVFSLNSINQEKILDFYDIHKKQIKAFITKNKED